MQQVDTIRRDPRKLLHIAKNNLCSMGWVGVQELPAESQHLLCAFVGDENFKKALTAAKEGPPTADSENALRRSGQWSSSF